MLPFRPPMNGAPVAPGVPMSVMPAGMGAPGMPPGIMAMRGPPPRGPLPNAFLPGQGPQPLMMPRGPMPLPRVSPGTATAVSAAPTVSLADLGAVTVFVGKLPTDLNDTYVRDLLEKCGHVVSWKRATDPVTLKPRGFGYCIFASAVDALRALRLLNGFSVASTQILAKVDIKIQRQLNAYTAVMPEALKQLEQGREDHMRLELKRLEDERSRLMGGVQNDPEISRDSLGPRVRKASADDRHKHETTDGSAVRDAGVDAVEVQVQQKMILNEIGTFRQAERQREQVLEPKRHDAEHLNQEKEEEEAPHQAAHESTIPSGQENNAVKSFEVVVTGGTDSVNNSQPAEVTDQEISPKKVTVADEKIKNAMTTRSRDRDDSRNRDREPRTRDRDREHRKRVRSHFRSRSRERSSRHRRRSRSHSRSRSRSRSCDRGHESRRDRKHGRERRRRRRNSSVGEVDTNSGERRSKRRRDSRSDDKAPNVPDDVVEAPKPAVKVVMDLKMTLAAPKKEKPMPGPAPSLFKVEDEVEVKPVREFVKIDFAEEERVATALAKQKAAETVAKINARTGDVKALVDSIPTDKAELFAYPINWTAVDTHNVVQEKMMPWVTKKVLEYLGEEDATLITFILTKLKAKATPDEILAELDAILEDDAEVFVKSLWRKLAFEALRAAV